MRRTVKIAGVMWYDLGSDVNWTDYGGRWARPAGPDDPGMWYALRFDEARDDDDDDEGNGYGCSVAIYEIRPSDVTDGALRSYGWFDDGGGSDGCDEYGDPIDPIVLDLMRVDAAVGYGEGIVERVSDPRVDVGPGTAKRIRSVAAKYAIGAFIGEHRYTWG